MVAVAVLLAAVVILLISYTFTRPIGKLMTAMKEIEKGDFKIQVVNKSRDEIGRLTESFNFMVSKIDHLVKEVYQEKIAQKNAELEALQAQINPHFLYNTLDSISWMLMDIGADDISDVVVSLGDILKYSIHGKDVLVPLNEEVQYIEVICVYRKTGWKTALHFNGDTEGDESLYGAEADSPANGGECHSPWNRAMRMGTVRITAGLEQQNLLITIEDNGPGMAPEELEQCRAAVYSESGPRTA